MPVLPLVAWGTLEIAAFRLYGSANLHHDLPTSRCQDKFPWQCVRARPNSMISGRVFAEIHVYNRYSF